MESVTNIDQIENLKENTFIGRPELNNSTIQFNGKNNLFYCERDVKLRNAKIYFEGNKSSKDIVSVMAKMSDPRIKPVLQLCLF